MSASVPTASNTIETLVQDPLFIRFPPFPEPPPGVTIMSFRDFKPRGIQLFSDPRKVKNDAADDDDVELDALGIPTVELRIKHATDECKSSSRKKRKKKKAAAVEAAGPVKKLPWYEEWEEGEDLRVTKVRYDHNVSPVDRFYQSAFDFRTGRPWPPVSSGLNNLWDQFRLFTGLLVNPSVFRKAGAKKPVRAESPDFDSDEDDDPGMIENGDSRPGKRHRPNDTPDLDDGDDDPYKLDEEVKEDKITTFLGDPELAVRIFLSSYMREHGLIWSERNLIHTPRLVSFFLAFVVRNRILPEPVYQRGLKRALDTIEQAKKELPLTYKVGQFIPDAFNEACRECFGRQGGINWSFVNATTTTTEQKDASITVTDISNGVKTDVPLPTEAQAQLKQVIEDNVDMDVSIDTSATVLSSINKDTANEDPTGWGTSWGNAWGEEQSQNGWGQSGGSWGQSGSWGDTAQDNGEGSADAKWGESDPSWNRDFASLVPLLGPSVFPLTHTTGIVECSTRRISAIHFPPGHPKGLPAPQDDLGRAKAAARGGLDWTPSAEGVEVDLEARFAKVILEPWGRVEGDICAPEIWHTSRGPVIDPTDPSKVLGDAAGTACRRPHNPLTDNITLLVKPPFAETLQLVPGLGLGAMWIEIARQKRGSGVDAQVDTDVAGKFWYHEDVTGIFPSFYTPRAKE